MNPTVSIGKSERFKNLTTEQGRAAISRAKSLKVKAPAGSGKTTLMMAYSAARPTARGLYMAFGKPTQIEADQKLKAMGVNTHAKTQHSLAYPSFGQALKNAGKLENRGGIRAAVTAEHLKVNYAMAAAINETVKNFMCSVEDIIGESHLPGEENFPVVKYASGAIIDGARLLWTRMSNPDDREVGAVDDVYLKQWVMTKPKLPYDFILFDECQDANPLTAYLVNMQTHCSRVYVGDPHQAIFGFRGAVNLMDDLEAEENHVLTQSFRFTPNIGLLASTYLSHWKNNQSPIIGKGKGGPLLKSDQQAYLSRTVAGLLAKGFELHSQGKKMHWVKGFDDYRVNTIMEAYALFKGDRSTIRDPVLKLMSCWSEFQNYVEESSDGDAGPVYRLIKEYGDETPNMIETLRANQVVDQKEASIVLATAHRVKGLEYPIVRLIDDFFSFRDKSGRWLSPREINQQEANLMYVALTRAQKAVQPNKETADWFRSRKETQHLFPKPQEPGQTPAPSTESSMPRAA